jgi:short-subunit dehydrogenase
VTSRRSSDLSTKLQIIDVNCRGPLMLVSELAPPMIERKRGGIILMSSASGFQGQAMISAYAASKAFNTVLGEGLWEELRHHGVDVLSFIAGATQGPHRHRRQGEQDRLLPVLSTAPEADVGRDHEQAAAQDVPDLARPSSPRPVA